MTVKQEKPETDESQKQQENTNNTMSIPPPVTTFNNDPFATEDLM